MLVSTQVLLLPIKLRLNHAAGLDASEGVRWISGGTGEFEVQQIDKASRGTDIILHLRDDA